MTDRALFYFCAVIALLWLALLVDAIYREAWNTIALGISALVISYLIATVFLRGRS